MKRATAHPQRLKHLAFFEVLSTAPEDSAEARRATAGLLTLRMVDHWVLAGPAIVEPESVSVRSVRQAIMAISPKEPVREALLTIVNTMQMLRQVDLAPVLPRVFAFGQLLERHHGAMALAADAYDSVIRLADAEFDADLMMDGYQRLAFCQRKLGALDQAAATSTALAKMAGSRKDRARVLRAKIGLGQVAMLRGELASADSQFVAVAVEAERHELTRELAMATHNRAVVASRAGNATDAVLLAHQALKNTHDAVERDRVLSDLGAFLIKSGRFDAAIDALRIVEITASSEEPRMNARVNIVSAAARSGNRQLFETAQTNINIAALPVEVRVNLQIEIARGLRAFDDGPRADELLASALREARASGLAMAIAEIGQVRSDTIADWVPTRDPVDSYDPTSVVAADLRVMAAAIAA